MLKPSENAGGVMQSDIRTMSVECERVRGVNLAQGVCDTDVPAAIRSAAAAAMDAGRNTYTRLDGIAPLRQAIARKLARQNGLAVDPETQVLVTSGATGAFFAAAQALLDPGDEVVLFEPFYGYHVNTLAAMRVRPVLVPLAAPEWSFDPERVEAAITPRTRALVVNTPANPSGKVFSRAELEQLATIAERHDLFVFTDEIYEHFVYDGHEHASPATLPGMAERTITISGFSKTYSITGWRIGFLAANRRWTPSIAYFHDLAYVCAPAPLQFGVLAGLDELPESFYADLSREYLVKRDRLCSALAAAGMTPSIPQGAYYVLADASRLPGTNARERALHLLERTGVASVPGSAFFHGPEGETLLRFCFAKKPADLAEACDRLRRLGESARGRGVE